VWLMSAHMNALRTLATTRQPLVVLYAGCKAAQVSDASRCLPFPRVLCDVSARPVEY